MILKLKEWARGLKRRVFVLYFAYKHHLTPWYAKAVAVCVVAYAFSPIDLIPDFIPVFGFLDDIILVPLGVALALRLIPEAVIEECTLHAEQRMKQGKPKNWLVGGLIIALWIAVGLWISVYAYRLVHG